MKKRTAKPFYGKKEQRLEREASQAMQLSGRARLHSESRELREYAAGLFEEATENLARKSQKFLSRGRRSSRIPVGLLNADGRDAVVTARLNQQAARR